MFRVSFVIALLSTISVNVLNMAVHVYEPTAQCTLYKSSIPVGPQTALDSSAGVTAKGGRNKIMKRAVVLGAGGFIGGHLVKRLQRDGYWVRAVDIKRHEFFTEMGDDFVVADLRDVDQVKKIITSDIDEVYQLAADMGGAEFVASGDFDADIMHNSALINLHVCNLCQKMGVKKVFYSSTACVYPVYNQLDPTNPNCKEDSAYPAEPDSEYGWEKLFSERLFLAYARNHSMRVRIARFHNIFGPYGTWEGGREKAPAAICRKVAMTKDGGSIEIFGDGKQTRSFLIVDECVEGVIRLINSDFEGPVNIGSEEMVTINELTDTIIKISGKRIEVRHISGPTGVRGRNSDNTLIEQKLGWRPSRSLYDGLLKTYTWVKAQVDKKYS
ncbi:unnamed protein product [Owenia fusiformis]|uniref:Uncharacterized protein n=1 Tax=Owenia fusiformis TaxID=6347 RepID=A0A8J1XR65_OWEFU|nr:unnamed protein product [Owenia fusiformis]